MNVEDYRRRLRELEVSLSRRTVRGRDAARAQAEQTVGDIGDASVADEAQTEAFTEAELDAAVLQQVQAALKRIDDGTFGRCVVDGGPIEEKRLQAVPWTPYCLKHQQLLEAAGRLRTPTL
jgi:DnaK suppressor protein